VEQAKRLRIKIATFFFPEIKKYLFIKMVMKIQKLSSKNIHEPEAPSKIKTFETYFFFQVSTLKLNH